MRVRDHILFSTVTATAASPWLGASALGLWAGGAYRIPGTVYLFDLMRADVPTFEPPPIRDPQPRCPLPAQQPEL